MDTSGLGEVVINMLVIVGVVIVFLLSIALLNLIGSVTHCMVAKQCKYEAETEMIKVQKEKLYAEKKGIELRNEKEEYGEPWLNEW